MAHFAFGTSDKMMTPRRRKQCEPEKETSIENLHLAKTLSEEELEPPPTPLKSPNHRARRRPRFLRAGQPPTVANLFSSPRGNNLTSYEEKVQVESQLCKDIPCGKHIQGESVESENGFNSQRALDWFHKHYSDKNNPREISSASESCKPPLFPLSPTIEKQHSCEPILHKKWNLAAKSHEEDSGNWMRDNTCEEIYSPVTEQRKLPTDVTIDNGFTANCLEMNTPKSCEKVLTCPYCHRKWKEEVFIPSSPFIGRCSLCSPFKTFTTPAPCNMNPFSPEARSQELGSPQQDTFSDMPTSSISGCSNVSKCLAFDSSCLPISANDSTRWNEQEMDGLDEDSEEEHFSFSAFSTGRLSCYKDDFEELEEIGSGTFGKVFKCRKRLDGWLYAVKSTRRKIRNQAEKHNVLREVYALAAMTDNPYVVRYFTAWIEDDILYIQTELCEGGCVMSLWKNSSLVLDTEKMREFIYQVASGLAIYHEKGLVHLDIKPENIYMTCKGTYKIGDLGLTALAENTFVQGYRIDLSEGDSRYIAPELLEENYEQLTKADIFSLGMTAYELCRHSKLPLPSGGEEWHRIRRGYLEPMNVSDDLACLIREMLLPDPLLRPSARDIIHRLGVGKDEKIAQLQRQLDQERNKCKNLEALVSKHNFV